MYMTLNSNLILLIQYQDSNGNWHMTHFKFQSDSINTEPQRLTRGDLEDCFKFQSDSINTFSVPVPEALFRAL